MRLVLNQHVPELAGTGKKLCTVMNVVDNTVYIYDYIQTYCMAYEEEEPEDDSVSSEKFLTTIRNMVGDITVRINSKGGEVGYGLSIYQALRERNGKVTTIVDGYAYSCASWILLAGEDRQIMPGGVVMTHNPGMSAFHDSEESFASALNQWKVNRDSVAVITSERTGQKIEDVYDMMSKQTFLNAKEAVAKGFCTSIRDGKASIPTGVSNFLPSAIRDAVPEIVNVEEDYSDLMQRSLVSMSNARTKWTI